MCDPATAVMATTTAISIGKAVADHKAQAKQSNAVAAAANQDRKLQIRDLTIRQQEESLAAQQAISQNAQQATQDQSLAKVSAAEAGITGSSLSLLVGNIQRNEAQNQQTNLDNLKITLDQLDRMKQGADAQAQNRIASAPQPSALATGLRIGGALTDFATSRINRKTV